jgi:hypothetical protein
MRRSAKYSAAVAWIALNDSAGDDEGEETVAGYLTVVLVADIFGVPAATVAREVLDYRAIAQPG